MESDISSGIRLFLSASFSGLFTVSCFILFLVLSINAKILLFFEYFSPKDLVGIVICYTFALAFAPSGISQCALSERKSSLKRLHKTEKQYRKPVPD